MCATSFTELRPGRPAVRYGSALERDDDSLRGIHGLDPRNEAGAALGRETVEGVVSTLAERVRRALGA